MKRLKKLLALVLVTVFALSLTACGGDAHKLAGTWEHETAYSGEIIDDLGGAEFFVTERYIFSKDGTVTTEVTQEALDALADAIWADVETRLASVANTTLSAFSQIMGTTLDQMLVIMNHTDPVALFCELENIDLADFEATTRASVTYAPRTGTWELGEDGRLLITFEGEEPLSVRILFPDKNTLVFFAGEEDEACTTFTRVK